MSSTGAPQSDGALNNVVRIKIRHYLQLYSDRSAPIVFLPVVVITSGHVYDDFVRLILLDAYRESSILTGELPKESGSVSFRVSCTFGKYKGLYRFDFSKNLSNESYYSST